MTNFSNSQRPANKIFWTLSLLGYKTLDCIGLLVDQREELRKLPVLRLMFIATLLIAILQREMSVPSPLAGLNLPSETEKPSLAEAGLFSWMTSPASVRTTSYALRAIELHERNAYKVAKAYHLDPVVLLGAAIWEAELAPTSLDGGNAFPLALGMTTIHAEASFTAIGTALSATSMLSPESKTKTKSSGTYAQSSRELAIIQLAEMYPNSRLACKEIAHRIERYQL